MIGVCPICGHDWAQHDPEDGRCDAAALEEMDVCKCGRNLPWMNIRIANLSRAALENRG